MTLVCEVTANLVPIRGTPTRKGERVTLDPATARRYQARGWVKILNQKEPA